VAAKTLARAACSLRSFPQFLYTSGLIPHNLANAVTAPRIRRGDRKAVTVAMDLGTLRQFFRYRCRFDPGGSIPGREWAPQAVKSDFVPHVFSVDQIRALLDEADRLRCDRRARIVMRALILILYCTGLRFGEAIRLARIIQDSANL
jgi:site-specific recombinase XerD